MEELLPASTGNLPLQAGISEGKDPRHAVVQRVLASPLFVKPPTLSRFFQYVCGQVFDGNASQINEQLIGIEVFGRKPGYDSNDGNIVRASASRLRSRLEAYFAGEGAAEEWIISIPPRVLRPPVRSAGHNRGATCQRELADFDWHDPVCRRRGYDPGCAGARTGDADRPSIPSARPNLP